jgi:hypothetical protein
MVGHMNAPAFTDLLPFRAALYEAFMRRRDALFELTDALLVAVGRMTTRAHPSVTVLSGSQTLPNTL